MIRKKILPFGALTTLAAFAFAPTAFAQNDEDDDGVSDVAETTILYTDPNVAGFNSQGAVNVVEPDFSDPNLLGEYAGVVYSESDGLVGYLSLTLSKGGKFSATLQGTGTRSSLRGQFGDDGVYNGANASNVSFVTSMGIQLAPVVGFDPENFRISGRLISAGTGTDQYFELRRARYSKTVGNTSPFSGNTTFVINPNTSVLGEGFGTAKLGTDGSQSFNQTLPDGSKLSFKGKTRFGEIMPVFSTTSGKGARSIAANYKIDPILVGSDYTGPCRILRLASSGNDLFSAGYVENRTADGAGYVAPGFSQLPNLSLPVRNNNVVVSFVGGIYGSTSRPSTWTTKGEISAPATQTQKLSLKANNKTGEFSGSYFTYDFVVKNTVKIAGVTQQKRSATVGTYNGPYTTGAVRITENINNTPPQITVVSPTKINAQQPGGQFQVVVQQSDPTAQWTVELPANVPWVDSNVLNGVGNGVVVITVDENDFGYERETFVTISGQKVRITQKAFFNN